MLSSLGKDVKMDLSESIASQVKTAINAMKKEVENCNSEIANGTQKLASSIQVVTKQVNTLSGKNGEIKTVTTGFNELGQAIREVTSNGKIISQSTSSTDMVKDANDMYAEQVG